MNKLPLKIVFAGTPQFSANHLYELILSKHHVIAVLTQPDRPSGRGKKITQSPVKILSKNHNIPVFQPKELKDKNNLSKFLNIKADIMIVIAYGLILPNFLLNMYPMGCINIHASLLPKWRGSAPIQWSILNGDKITGITTIYMNNSIDTGNIIHSIKCNIDPKDTTYTLTKKLSKIGIKAMFLTLEKIQNKCTIFKKQNHNHATYAIKIQKNMAKINFFIEAKKIEKMTRAFNPWPGTYIKIQDKIIKIWKVSILKNIKKYKIGEIISINKDGIQIQTIKNILNIEKIQIPGKKIIKISDFINSKQKIFLIGKIINNNINY